MLEVQNGGQGDDSKEGLTLRYSGPALGVMLERSRALKISEQNDGISQ